MAMNGGVLQKVAGLDAPGKGGLIQKIIIDTIALARARGAGCAGDGASHLRVSGQKVLAQGGFSSTGGSRYDDQ
jgi:hypothetical protein